MYTSANLGPGFDLIVWAILDSLQFQTICMLQKKIQSLESTLIKMQQMNEEISCSRMCYLALDSCISKIGLEATNFYVIC